MKTTVTLLSTENECSSHINTTDVNNSLSTENGNPSRHINTTEDVNSKLLFCKMNDI